MTPCFQTNLDSVYNNRMVSAVFGSIVENRRSHYVFNIIIPSLRIMLWGVIRCMSRSPLVPIDGILNNVRYISVVLKHVVLLFIRDVRNSVFQQDNARPLAANILRTFLDTKNL